MKITPVAGPHAIQQAPVESEQARTARLTEKFTQIVNKQSAPPPQAQEHPVINPSAVGVEELSAIKAPTQAQASDNNTESAEVTAPAEAKPAPAKDPEAERRFAQIARQERQLRAKIQQANIQLKQREEALKVREAALTPSTQFDPSKYVERERIKQDALTVLEESGVQYDALTQQILNRQPTDPRVMSSLQQLQEKQAKIDAMLANLEKTQQQRDVEARQAAIKQIRNDAKQLVYTDPEFETVKAMNAVKDVVELIERTYDKDGVILSVEEAAKEVENYLVEEAMKITQIGKIKKRMAAANASQLKSDTKTPQSQQPQMKTLTNATSSTRPLTARERAIAAMEGRLKP
jgi:hypothetical protein